MNDLISAFVSLFQLALFVSLFTTAIWVLVDQIRTGYKRVRESRTGRAKKPPTDER